MKNGHDSHRIQEMTDEERAWYLVKTKNVGEIVSLIILCRMYKKESKI